MKNYLKQALCAAMLVFVGLTFSSSSVSAQVCANGSVDSSGNFGITVGTTGTCNSSTTVVGGGWMLNNPYNLPGGSILGILTNLLYWLLAIFAVVGVIGFVLSGIFYLLAGADEGNAEKGKEGMKWSIVGILVGLSGFIIMQAVAALLGGASHNF